jgi:hypothetical protein
MFEKIKATLPLAGSSDFLLIFALLITYHFILFLVFYFVFVVPNRTKMRRMEAHLLEEKKRQAESWQDREEEMRIMLTQEKNQEIMQLKAEYDSYVSLLEQKLHRSMSKGV